MTTNTIKKIRNEEDISIIISVEHADYLPQMNEYFSGIDINASYIRKSRGDLPIKIIIFLGGVIVSGVTWDIIKLGIQKAYDNFFKKKPDISIKFENISFSIDKDGSVKAITLDYKIFSHIKTLDDLYLYIQGKTQKELPNSKWEKTTLGKVVNITMGQSPKSETYNEDGDGFPFYQGITDFGDKFVKIKTYSSNPIKVVEQNTILFSVRAPVGKINITKHKACIGRGNAGLFMKNSEQEFLFYLLKYLEKQFLNRSSGTVFDSINRSEIENFPILLPPLPEQKAIAGVLSTFDDKIELLREQNETLEKIGQELFKEWFGKYKVGDDLPEDWRVGKLGEIGTMSSGKGVKKKDYVENGKYEIWGANGSIGKYDKYLINIPTIATGRVGTLGNVFILDKPIRVSDNVLMVNSNQDYYFYYIYFFLKHYPLVSLNSGSTQPLITQSDLKILKLIIPHKTILEKFNLVIAPIFDKIKNNSEEIQTLSKTRDTLLPKLMKGEVRVNFLEFKF